ncbi:uncharacterized protein LY79DRAFT_38701 [Colletotrichum navitas]|uniref:Uncharacterized protein n=1 Tax=Colletotrichum navitas TaxID=681940 RepID=A0AAD8UXT1_9PEZI|nr:uncharacterized protein LY79DRAFT_38701 [Colletotrichum navitas]KAK1572966.1 hypothetical protein LY79DRAFT_38701 [Colletotrichum navitas]
MSYSPQVPAEGADGPSFRGREKNSFHLPNAPGRATRIERVGTARRLCNQRNVSLLVLAPAVPPPTRTDDANVLVINRRQAFFGSIGRIKQPGNGVEGHGEYRARQILTLPRGYVLYVDVDAMWAFWATRPRPCASIWGEILVQAFFFYFFFFL